MVDSVLTGKVVQFDMARGFGFIRPDAGGEDVFLHASEVEDDRAIKVGLRVSYDVIEGERGYKARDVRIVSPPSIPFRGTGQDDSDEGDLLDVIRKETYAREITEALISIAPAVTAAQIVALRDHLVTRALKRGWVED